MLLYHGMYNVPHFAITNSLPFETNTLVGDASDYKRLRKICYESGSAYINDSLIGGETIRGGAKVSVQYDTIFMAIIPDSEEMGIVITIKFFLGDDERMYAYADKRTGGGSGAGVSSFNGRTGAVVSGDEDYNADMIAYDNEVTELVAETVQDAIDEICDEIDSVVEMIPTELSQLGSDENHLTVTEAEKTSWDGKADVSQIPTKLAQLANDSTHKTVTQAEKDKWNARTQDIYYASNEFESESDVLLYALNNSETHKTASFLITWTGHTSYCGVIFRNYTNSGIVFYMKQNTQRLYQTYISDGVIGSISEYAPVS